MLYMNDGDILAAYQRHTRNGRHTSAKAAMKLDYFRDHIDQVSDGWAYWRPAVKSAKRLIELVQREDRDATETELKRALTPIKSFCTRKGLNYQV